MIEKDVKMLGVLLAHYFAKSMGFNMLIIMMHKNNKS
jgi:hypothetical protein